MGSICHTKSRRFDGPIVWASIKFVVMAVLASGALVGCGFKTKIEVGLATPAARSQNVTNIRPIQAKPSQVVTLTGSDFGGAKKLYARVSLADGSTKDVPLNVIDSTSASLCHARGRGARSP